MSALRHYLDNRGGIVVARLFILVTLIVGVVTIVSCSSTVAQPTLSAQSTSALVPPTATAQPKASTTTPQASSNGQQKLNLDDYFPKGAGRDLVLRDCTTCHSFVPIITGQRPKARWLSLKEDHKDKASGVSQSDYDVEFTYLTENFDDTKPEPKLPDWFIKQQPGVGE